jgi:hypothetical protein
MSQHKTIRRMKKPVFIFIAFLLVGFNDSGETANTVKKIQVTKIWDEAPHSAFTSLVRFEGAFHCSFREGSDHVPGTDGKIRVIKSTDGKKWESIALMEKDKYDLRDPMLSVTPDRKIMLSIGGSIYDADERSKLLDQHPLVSFSNARGAAFSEPEKVSLHPPGGKNWIWRVT